MAVNAAGTIYRTAEDEAEDTEQIFDNLLKESWKDWKNEAGFEGLEEHVGPVKLRVHGTIPAWTAGSLYRTGPGQSALENTSRGTHYVSHWFDGFAHSHKFDIIAPDGENGDIEVIYSSRRQSEDYVTQIKEMGWRCNVSFAQKADPCVGIFAKFMSLFVPRQQNNNVVLLRNFPGLPDKNPATAESGHRTSTSNVYVSTDNSFLQEINSDTLQPLGYTNQVFLHPDLKGPLSCAHAQRDPETGDWFNYNLALGRQATYRIFRVNAATGTTDILATITDPDLPAAYIHSLFLTENYVILCIPSTHFAWSGLKILWERNLVDAIKPFDKSRRCQWIVVDRRKGQGIVARFSTPAAFFFHSVNAFEEYVKEDGDEKRTDLILDLSLYDNADIIFAFYYDILLDRNESTKKHYLQEKRYKNSHNRLVRYKFRMPVSKQSKEEASKATADEVLSISSPHSGELPTIHPERATRPYRYVYSTSNRGLSTFMDSLVKTDLETREARLWSGPKGHSPGEPIFVPRPGGTLEDDGVILSLVLDGTAQKSYLLCLDARTMDELGRAEADFPIAMGFHGFHAPVTE